MYILLQRIAAFFHLMPKDPPVSPLIVVGSQHAVYGTGTPISNPIRSNPIYL